MSCKLETAQVPVVLVASPARRSNRVEDRHWPTVVAALFAVYIIWGSTYLGIRVALEGFPPMIMSGVRFMVAGGGLYIVLRARGAAAPSRAQWRGAALVGILLLLAGNGGVTFAEQWVSSSLAALAVGATPIWAALFAGLLGRWPNRLELAGLGVGFAGLVVLNLDGSMRASPLGAIILLIAPACWALGSMLSHRVVQPQGLMAGAAQLLVGGALLLCMGVARGERIHAVPGPHAIIAVIYLTICGSLVAFSAYSYLLRHTRPAVATSYAYVNPTVAVILGVFLAGEHVGAAALLAMPVILAGVVLVLLGRDRR